MLGRNRRRRRKMWLRQSESDDATFFDHVLARVKQPTTGRTDVALQQRSILKRLAIDEAREGQTNEIDADDGDYDLHNSCCPWNRP